MHIHTSPALQHVKVVIPTGLPCKHLEILGNVWYNIPMAIPVGGQQPGETRDYGPDTNDVKITLDYFEELVEGEMRMGTPAERIVFVGYSQGAGLVVLFTLTRALGRKLGGLALISGFGATTEKEVMGMIGESGLGTVEEGKGVPVLMEHGKRDKFVAGHFFWEWKEILERNRGRGEGIGSIETVMVEGLGHAWRESVYPDLREWLERRIPRDEVHNGAKL